MSHRTHPVTRLVPLLLAAAACSDGTHGAAGARLQTPNPRHVALDVDSARATSELIRARRGGVVFVEAGDGTTYTLTIPADALLSDERITLAPVVAVTDLPLSGGLVAAVRLAPEGLRFLKPATLEIEPANSVPAAEQIAFATDGHGAEFHLYPTEPSRARIAMPVLHFSTIGVGRGTARDVSAAAQHPPTSGESQFEQRRGAIIERERARQASGGADDGALSGDATAELGALLHEEYDVDVRPLLVRATSDDALADSAVRRFFTWGRWVVMRFGENAVNGEFKAQSEEGTKLVRTAIRNAFEQAYQRCINDAAITPHVRRMLTLARTSQLLGAGELLKDAGERIDRCARFELYFESRSEYRFKEGSVSGSDVVEATVPLRYDMQRGTFSGSAPLVATSSTSHLRSDITGMEALFGSCDLVGIGTVNGTLTVHEAVLNLNPTKDTTTRVAVLLTPSDLRTRVRASNCTAMSKANTGKEWAMESMWEAGWRDHHGAEGDLATTSGGLATRWRIVDWEPVGRAVVARKTMRSVLDNVVIRSSEETRLELRHTPER